MTAPATLSLCAAIAGSFLAGALPFGYWIGRARGVDVRSAGSGNIGFTNVWRCVGRREGAITLLLDILKGALPTLLLPRLWGAEGAAAPPLSPDFLALACGLAAILGHCYTPFAGFRGGKGVATSLGVFLVLAPGPVLITLALFVIVVALSGYISLGSVISSVALAALIGAFQGVRAPLFWLSAALGAFVIWRHRENMTRLRAGTERKFTFRRAEKNGDSPISGKKEG